MLEQLLPIHPKLVHFPIALIVSAAFIQVLGLLFRKDAWCQSAWVMYHLFVVSVPVVILSGLWEEQRLGLEHPLLDTHKQFGFAALWVSLAAFLILWVIRVKKFKIFQNVFLISLLVATILIILTAHYGGKMVYESGIGGNQ